MLLKCINEFSNITTNFIRYLWIFSFNSFIVVGFMLYTFCRVGWGCRIETAEYTDCISAERIPPHEFPGYDTKQSDGEVPVMLEFWGMWSTLLSPLLPGPLWLRVVAPDRVLSLGQIGVNCGFWKFFFHFNCVLRLNWIIWNKKLFTFNFVYCPLCWGCRIYRLHLCRGGKPPCPWVSLMWL